MNWYIQQVKHPVYTSRCYHQPWIYLQYIHRYIKLSFKQ